MPLRPLLGSKILRFSHESLWVKRFKLLFFKMHPNKALSPNDMSPSFFQNFWHIIGNGIIECCLNFLYHGVMPKNFNVTNIALIPKCTNSVRITDLRPISLCNVVY